MRLKKVEAALDWAYRQSYSFAEEAALEYAEANGLILGREDLGQYGDKLSFSDASATTTRARTGEG